MEEGDKIGSFRDCHVPISTDGDIWAKASSTRAMLARQLFRFAKVQVAPLVMGLDGSWGTGKTFFLTRFQAFVRQQEGFCIYLNAWKHDYIGNPLLYVYQGIINAMEGGEAPECIDRAALDTLVAKGKALVFNTVNLMLAGAPSKILAGFGKIDERSITDKLQTQSKDLALVKEELTAVAAEVYKTTGAPLIVVIDELDRCRPLYAIDMLERLKHVFAVPHTVFILGMDIGSLAASVESVYGKIGGDKYLDRFIQYRVKMPVYAPAEYFERLWEEWAIAKSVAQSTKGDVNGVDSDKVLQLALPIIMSVHCSLRDVEFILRGFQVGLIEGVRTEAEAFGLFLLCVLKSVYRVKYDSFIGGEGNIDALVECFEINGASHDSLMWLLELLNVRSVDSASAILSRIHEEFKREFEESGRRRSKGKFVDSLIDVCYGYGRLVVNGAIRVVGQSHLMRLALRLEQMPGEGKGS